MSAIGFDGADGLVPGELTAEAPPADATAARNDPNWSSIAATRPFRDLLAAKKRFILPAFFFFLIYYFSLPILAGCAPRLLSTRVVGGVSIGLLLEMSQFLMGWLIAWRYVKAAAGFDQLAKTALEQAEVGGLIRGASGAQGDN